ncbi:hypothetical protein D3C76_1712060 [compost metagenome]
MKLLSLFNQQSQHIDSNVAVAHDDGTSTKTGQKLFLVWVIVQESSYLPCSVDVIECITWNA